MSKSKQTATLLILLVSLLALLVPSTLASENSWVTLEPMPTARSGLGVAAVNGKIYAVGGTTASGFVPSIPGYAVLGNNDIGGIVATNEMYNPETDTWTTNQAMPTPRIVFATAVFQNKIYCIGGKTSDGFTAVNEVYDTETDTWQTKTSMPTARGWVTANVVNDKIYVVNGESNEMYDPKTDTWTTKSPPPSNAGFPDCVSAAYNKKIYVIGGLSEDQHYVLNRIYDTETDTWSYGSSPPSSMGGGETAATTGVYAPELLYFIGYNVNFRQ